LGVGDRAIETVELVAYAHATKDVGSCNVPGRFFESPLDVTLAGWHDWCLRSIGMTPEELRTRTARFASRVVRFARQLPADPGVQDIAGQLSRAAASTAAHYRAACLARSHAEFRSKIGIALEEADESVFWMELLEQAGLERAPS
jgi:four helix bundle protein